MSRRGVPFARATALLMLAGLALRLGGCGSARPVHLSRPVPDARPRPAERVPPKDDAAFGGGIDVRVALHWTRGAVEVSAPGGLKLAVPERAASARAVDAGNALIVSCAGRSGGVRARASTGRYLEDDAALLVIKPQQGRISVDGREVRGSLRITSRAESLFVVNVLPLEDYLRGVVPKEIGPRPPADEEAVAAQAVAARTYTVKRLDQYESLPFDLFADVQDQVYDGVAGEHVVADDAIRRTRGLVLADDHALIETFYSSTCGGKRSDIAAVWPHRPVHPALRGGPDGAPGREWCRESRHFQWEETWNAATLGAFFRKYAPALLERPEGSIKGELRDLRVTKRGPSGRVAEIEWVTDRGRWTVPGDKNRWIFRRPDGGILRSVWIDLDLVRHGGRLALIRAHGRGNGHGVGLCQFGALGRARAGQGFREILQAYYPGTRIRPVQGSDLPPGRPGAS